MVVVTHEMSFSLARDVANYVIFMDEVTSNEENSPGGPSLSIMSESNSFCPAFCRMPAIV